MVKGTEGEGKRRSDEEKDRDSETRLLAAGSKWQMALGFLQPMSTVCQ